MKQILYILSVAAVVLAGCNKQDDVTPDTWNGEIRLTSGIMSQLNARANNPDVPDKQIADGKIVNFFVDDAGNADLLYENYQLVANGLGGFTKPTQQSNDMYFPISGHGVDIYAFLTNGTIVNNAFPTAAITHTVSNDQSEQHGANYLSSDLLYAASKGVARTSQQVPINFYHMLSKVEVAIRAGAGVTDLSGAIVTIENTQLKANFLPVKTADINDASSGQATRANMITSLANSVGSIKVGSVVSADFSSYASAVVVPQTLIQNTRFIKVKLPSGGEFYYTIPDANGLKLESGHKYQFRITVNLTGLTVESTILDWTTGTPIEGDAVMPPPIGSKTATQATVGDFYFNDGSLEDKAATLTEAQKAACLGVVYWVGDPANTTDGDPLLKTNHPGCTHGLVVALHDASDPSTSAAMMNWSVNTEQVNNWTNSDDRGVNKVNITVQNKLQGYANTVALKAYNAQQSNADLKVLPIAAVEQYQTNYPAPTSSSGWYVPSFMELKYVCWGQGNGESTTGRELLSGQFAKVGGTNFDSWYYWSSSESADDSRFAWSVTFNYGDVYGNSKSNGAFWVRPLLAF